VISLGAYRRGRYHPRMLVVRSEVRRLVRNLLRHANKSGILTVAISHPVVDFRPRRPPYVISHTVLCAGPYAVRRLHGRRLVMTGYPGFDEMPQVPQSGPATPRVLVNDAILHALVVRGHERREVHERWLEEIETACRAVNLPLVVSRHPRSVPPQRPLPTDSRPIYDLLTEATLLITPPSSVLMEGLQMGVPCVCHRAPAGTAIEVDTFDEPLGAFRNTVGAEPLAEAVAEARSCVGRAREVAQAFLADHVSTVPGRTMTQRVVDALVEQLDRPERERTLDP